MKSLKQMCAALSLALVLSLSALAGNMPTGVVDPPPPPDQNQQAGIMPTGLGSSSSSSSATALDPVTETILNLVQSLITIF